MPDIPIHNDTHLDLPLRVLEDIKLESVEYFGERVRSIRVQSGILRHAFNYKTYEVRYAFFLHDYVAHEADSQADDISSSRNGLPRSYDHRLSPSNRDEEMGEDEEMCEDDAAFALIDEAFDAVDHDDDADVTELDPDFDEMKSRDLVYMGDETDDD